MQAEFSRLEGGSWTYEAKSSLRFISEDAHRMYSLVAGRVVDKLHVIEFHRIQCSVETCLLECTICAEPVQDCSTIKKSHDTPVVVIGSPKFREVPWDVR
jgi:hypothetical protein